jgi:hypothetical protein
VEDQQADQRDEDPLGTRQAECLRFVAAHELDEEPEDPCRQQVGPHTVARNGDSIAVAEDDPDGDEIERDLVKHRGMHRDVATRASSERRGRGRAHRHAPRQRGGRSEWQLGQEAADPTDGRRNRDRQEIGVAGRARVPERALEERDREVASSERADDALAAVLDDLAERPVGECRVDLEVFPRRDQSCADRTPEDRAE